ncbi:MULTISPECIES: glycosyltransferase family 4 protein [unclassified Pseudomonas]|uniref:glycosyltransferase family 4 protein n=1 Tax=unclassified Pseudomonas TaxID=196821 RepID=UPI0023B8D3F2|nr:MULTISPECIES: glycosyltransferase family 1 protein [unclassified Pseudomonas]
MRLLVECTYVYEHPQDNSGIQRVVRNIIGNLSGVQVGVECVPVMISGGRLYRVLSLEPLAVDRAKSWRQRLIMRLDHARNRYWCLHARLERLLPFRDTAFAKRLLYWPCKLLSLGITLPLRGLLWLNRNAQPAPQRAVELQVRDGDQLLLLDSSWHADFFELAERLKNRGIGIISVIYDLIPLTHPQFCDAGLVKVFDRWFDWVSKTADGFMAISQTVSKQVDAELQNRLGPAEAAQRWHGYFHLGSELDLNRPAAVLHKNVRRMFEQQVPVYLMVSTVEPRKNHAYLLDAFELLWADGADVCLCIIGKIGWKCEALIERIKRHPQYGKRLFMFNDVNDKSLEFAYSNARALVFPSHAEGFGLPLVEAMQRGLPVMASDIPVFREVGQDFMAYFDLHDPASLVERIKAFELSGRFPAARAVEHWQWVDWAAAADQLVTRTLRGIQDTSRKAMTDADCP